MKSGVNFGWKMGVFFLVLILILWTASFFLYVMQGGITVTVNHVISLDDSDKLEDVRELLGEDFDLDSNWLELADEILNELNGGD